MGGDATGAEAASSAPPLDRYSTDESELVGRVLDGRYLVQRVLGRGGMALVLGARHVFLDKPVAIKILHPALTALGEMKTRFLREARATSLVAHPNVVTVSDFGVSPEGLYYLVMEHLEGQDLHAWLDDRGVATVHEASVIAVDVCAALEAIHRAGFVHRDLKPENIFVVAPSDDPSAPSADPRIKVLDLGIAALVDGATEPEAASDGHARRLTRSGQTLGTVHYMSPEQAMGNPVDGRSDLYALGCIARELVTGAYTFDAPTPMDVMLMHVSTKPTPIRDAHPEVPLWFDQFALKCLAKRPEDRFQSASEARAALLAAMGGGGPLTAIERPTARRRTLLRDETGPAAPAHTLAPGSRRARWPWLAAPLVAAAALVVVRVASPGGGDDPAASSAGERAAAPGSLVRIELPSDPSVVATQAGAPVATQTGADASATPAQAAGAATGLTRPSEAVPGHVTLRFEIDPIGATVTRDGAVVGAAPFALEVPRGPAPIRFELAAPGRVPLVVPVTPDGDQTLARTLAPLTVKPLGKAPATSTPGTPGKPDPTFKPEPATQPGAPGPSGPSGKTPDGLWRPSPPPGTTTPR